MTNKKMTNFRKAAFAIASAMTIWGAPALAANDASQCASITDILQRAQCECEQGQIATKMQTSSDVQKAILGNGADVPPEPFFDDANNKKPGDLDSLGVPGISKSCNQITKGAFDSFLGSAGSVFGFDVGTLFSGAAGAASGAVCQEINSAIMKRTSIACPKVKIPGFPVNCGANIGVSASGVTLTGNGKFGGYSTGGSGQVGANGVGSARVTYEAGTTGRGSAQTTINADPQAGPQSPGILSNIGNNIGCWLNAGSNCK